MTKKIFKIIGIVFASIIVFVGAVFGIMAIMGKFKTPDVYPNRLQFIDNEQTVIYQDNNPDKLYSFVLNGFSDNLDYEVNQKDCYIYFVNNIGSDLITLCDSKGNPLVSENNRYSIECNEHVYYKIKDVSETDFSNSNYGQVILQARDSRSQVQSNNLTIWVDREISNLSLDYGSSSAVNGRQEITIGVDVEFEFNYLASPEHSLDPISKENGKIVELYYLDSNEYDYVPINQDTYQNYSFIKYDIDNKKYSFSTDSAGTYEFKIAVFSTYQDREDYLNSDFVDTDSYFERVSGMINTSLIVNVVNSDISNVGMNSSGVGLNLYSDNNYITLSGQSGVDGANDNDLGLYMIKDGVATNIRFNEVAFTLNQNNYPDNWSDTDIIFVSDDKVKTIRFNYNTASISGFGSIDGSYGISFDTSKNIINLNGLNNFQLTYALDNVSYDENTTLIKSFTCDYEDSTYNFACSVGAAFLQYNDDGSYNIKLLKSGSYLEFYIYDNQSINYTIAKDFVYTAQPIGSGNNKSWNIVAKNNLELSDNESLVLGILVVNNNGGAYFASTGVTITPVELTFEFVNENQTHNLQVEYNKNEDQVYSTIYPELELDDIVNIISGSYDACVFITPKVDITLGEVYDIEVIEGMVFVDALNNEYVLVGYMQGNHFVNKVKVRKGARNSNTPIYMLQLQNSYNQTSSEYIQEIIENQDNNITLRYSIQIENVDGSIETKYVKLTMFNGELVATLEDHSAVVSSVFVQNNNLVVTINDNSYICNFISLDSDGSNVYLGNKSQTQDKPLVANVVNSYISDSRKVSITVSYGLLPNEVNFNYNAGNIDGVPLPDGGDTYLSIVDGNVYVVENTTNHSLTLTSNVPDMLKDIYYANGFDLDNIKIYMYNASNELISQNSNALEITNLEFNSDSLVLSYNSTSALANADSYLRIVLSYNGKDILSDKIYIESTVATNIQFKYTDETNSDLVYSIDLAETPEIANDSEFYIKIVISYDINANDYVYRYFIVDNNNGIEKEIFTDIYTTLFNSYTNGTISEGFQVLPAINGIAKDITYSSNTPSVAEFNNENGLNLSINKIGSTIITVSCDDITRYFKIVVDTAKIVDESAFSITNASGDPIIQNIEATTQDISVSLSNYIRYTYNNDGNKEQLKTNAQNVSIENVQISQFGGDRDLSVEYTESGSINIVANISPEESLIVLTIESDETSWKFTRVNYLYAGLIITFDVNVKACETISFELTFTSSVEININSNWNNLYSGTQVLLYEQNETGQTTNEPVFKIKNTISGAEISCRVYINGSEIFETIENAQYVLGEAGSYRFSFVYNESELDSYTINVVPNVVAILNDDARFNGGDTYKYSDLLTLKSFKTDVVYGLDSVGIYPMSDAYLVDISTTDNQYSNISLSLMDNSIITINSVNLTFTVGWIENIGEEIIEDIGVNYNYSVGDSVRSINLANTEITLCNKYIISRETQGDNYPEYQDNVYTIMSNIIYLSFVEIQDATQFSLFDVKSNLSNLEFEVLANNKFKLITNISNEYNNVILTFTFKDESTGNILIYSTSDEDTSIYSISIVPLSPKEIETIAYSGLSNDEAFDLLNDLYDIDTLLATLADDSNLFVSMTVETVSDTTIFANTSFIGSGYINGQNYGANAVINEIEGNSTVVYITYKISYIDGVEYRFTRELTIKNRQSISITTPFVDNSLTGTTTSFVFVGDSIDDDVKNLNAMSQGNNAYQLTINSYFEPVNMGQTMNFVYDDVQSVGRVSIFNSKDDTRVQADFNIELLAYQNKGNTINYFNSGKINIDNETKTVTFNQDITFGNGGYGYFIFKITSESGSVGYYYVYLYNQFNTNYNNVNYTNEYTFNSSINTEVENTFISNDAFLGQALDYNFFNSYFGANNVNYNNIDFYLLDANMIEGDYYALVGSDYARQGKIDDKKLPILNNYTYLKIGMVFNSSNTKFYLGTVNVYVLPTYIESYSNITPLISGLSTGEYTKTISSDIESFDIPFTSVNNRLDNSIIGGNWTTEIVSDNNENYLYSSSSISSKDGSKTILNLDGTTINFDSYINNSDLQFTVKYIYNIGESENKFVLLVHYTYEEIGVNNNAIRVDVGQFVQNNDETVINSYFNNRIDLSTLIGNYNKNLTILYSGVEYAKINLSDGSVNQLVEQIEVDDIITFNNGCSLNYIKEDGFNYLQFEQTTSGYTEQFVIRLDDIVDENGTVYSKTITANVLSGLYYSQPQAGVGYSQDNPMNTTIVSEDNKTLYESNYGSSIIINTSNNEDTGVTRYYVGGLNIYTNVSSELDISLSDSKYLVDKTSGQINFVHTAQDKSIILYIKVKDMSGNIYQSSGADLQLNFYINVVKTYSGIKPVYYVSGATHENIVSGHKIEDVYSEIFKDYSDITVSDVSDVNKSNIINTRKIAILDLKGNLCLTYSPSAVGFNVLGNPNYIEFTAGENMNLVSNDNLINLTFSTVSTNTLSNLHLSNDAGIQNITYVYQIMSSTEYIDGLDYQVNTHGLTVDENSEYVALTINDKNESTPLIYGNKENGNMMGNHIATLFDGNNSVFYISDISIKIDNATTSYSNIVKYDRVETSNYPDDIVYVISINNNITLTIRLGTGRRLYVGLERTGGSLFDTLSINLTLYGDSGNLISLNTEPSITYRNLEIKFYNYTLESNYSSTYDSVYATNPIDLSEKVSIVSNKGSGTLNLTNAELDTTGNASSYLLNGTRYYITSAENNIFEYTTENNKNIIMTNAVGANASVSLLFNVIDTDGYYIGSIQYNFMLRPNFDFKVNHNSLSSGDNEFYSNYIMMTSNITQNENNDLDYSEDLNNVVDNYTIQYDGKNYYIDLLLELYTADGTNQKITDINNVSITEVSSWGSEYVTIEGFKINIHKDFTGLLILKLDINLRENGTYTVYWNINVLGFISLNYKSIAGENAILVQSNGEAFTSGTTVDIVSLTSKDETGVIMSDIYGEISENPSVNNSFEIPSIEIDYVISPFTDIAFDADTTFDSGSQIETTTQSLNNIYNDNIVSTTLPTVPQSSGPNYDYYNVTYRLRFTYLDQTTIYYYVTYKVYNSATVNINADSVIIDVDSDIIEGNSAKFIDLFYFAEIYEDESGNIFTLRLDSGKNIVIDVVLDVVDNATYGGVYIKNGSYFEKDNYKIQINQNNENYLIKILNTTNETLKEYTTTKNIVSNYEYKTGDIITNKSIFSSEYSNINSFKTFMDTIDSVRFNIKSGFTSSNEQIYFKLVYIEGNDLISGRFGIDLMSPYTSEDMTDNNKYDVSTNQLFNNELIADLDIMASSNAIIHIDAFDSSLNAGFKLTTSNVIEAKGQYRIRDMFIPTQCDSTSYLNYYVIGVSDSISNIPTNWVSSFENVNANSVSEDDLIGTITVDNLEYKLYEISYTGTGNDLYNLTAQFYAIIVSGAKIVSVDYGTNIQSYFFQVNYTNIDSVLDLYGKFATYENDLNGKFTKTTYSEDNNLLTELSEVSTNYSSINDSKTIITVTKEQLRQYKNANPTETALRINYTATYNGVQLTFRVNYQLPEYPFVSVNIDNINNINILNNQLFIYDIENGGNLVELNDSNVSQISSIVENSTNYTSEIELSDVNYTGKIVLDNEKIEQYFIDNPNASRLEILYTITTGAIGETQYSMQFAIVVEKNI